MVNDPKEDKDLKNNDESAEETGTASVDDQIDEATDSDESEEPVGALDEGSEDSSEVTDDIEEAVVVEEKDTAALSETETETERKATPPPAPDTSGSSVFAMTAGGLIAGGIGFLVATYAVPEGWPNNSGASGTNVTEELAATSDALALQSDRLDALQAELANAPAPQAEAFDSGPLDNAIGSLTSELGTLSDRLDGLDGTLEGLDSRIAALELRPIATMPDGSDAMAAQMQAFQADLDAVTETARQQITAAQEELAAAQAKASEVEAEAEEKARAAQQAAAVASIKAALDSGAPFTEELASLDEVPEALSSIADSGAPTLGSLASEFPASAREALSSAQATPEDAGAGDKLAAFLRRQTNARSLAPREGDGVDAVLSRAEAALTSGDLATALAEIESLPDAPKSALAGWVDAATTRMAAIEAAETLSAKAN